MFATPSYGGSPIFGLVTSFAHIPTNVAKQAASFAGVPGMLNLFCGSRGRTFQIRGVFTGPDIPTVNSMEANLLSFADGIARTLTDTRGRSFDNVIFENEYQPDAMGPRPTDTGWCLAYSVTFRGLT
jgi:hypothetical protein